MRKYVERFDGGCGTTKEDLPLFDNSPLRLARGSTQAGGSIICSPCTPIPDRNFTEYTCETYDLEHPAIWQEFEKVALRQIDKGYSHLGAKAIFEFIRFNTPSIAEFPKLNNNMTAYYARKFIKLHPEHEGYFETRKTKVN